MKKKRSTSRRYVTVADRIDQLSQTVSDNHAATVERLTRIETRLSGLPEKVAHLERKADMQTGVVAAISFTISAVLTYLGLRHH